MPTWHRVFGSNPTMPEPQALLEHLQQQGHAVSGQFRGDDQGWFRAELILQPNSHICYLDRYLSLEDGLRAELNTWAAWLETEEENPQAAQLMERIIRTVQLFTIQPAPTEADDSPLLPCCLQLCRFLAELTNGIYQVDSQGFFDANGALLLKE